VHLLGDQPNNKLAEVVGSDVTVRDKDKFEHGHVGDAMFSGGTHRFEFATVNGEQGTIYVVGEVQVRLVDAESIL
jgi:hypothetical protein